MKNFTEISKKNHEKPSCQNPLLSKALAIKPDSSYRVSQSSGMAREKV